MMVMDKTSEVGPEMADGGLDQRDDFSRFDPIDNPYGGRGGVVSENSGFAPGDEMGGDNTSLSVEDAERGGKKKVILGVMLLISPIPLALATTSLICSIGNNSGGCGDIVLLLFPAAIFLCVPAGITLTILGAKGR
jgi:hypothetical protein